MTFVQARPIVIMVTPGIAPSTTSVCTSWELSVPAQAVLYGTGPNTSVNGKTRLTTVAQLYNGWHWKTLFDSN